jgi:iron uptake system component EfeO
MRTEGDGHARGGLDRSRAGARSVAGATRQAGWRQAGAGIAAAAGLALLASGCSSSAGPAKSAGPAGGPGKATTVSISLTPQGCSPAPARIPAGQVQFSVANKGADSVSEAELRTADLSKILGEQENLTPGLSGGFALDLQPGTYKISCPGAARQQWDLTVTGKAAGPSWQSDPQLAAAVKSYSAYIGQNTTELVAHTRAFCQAISAGDMNQAEILYPRARIYYERIEPVAEIWGSLDTEIDGRWENPVTVASQFTGFHKIEELIWEDHTLTGTPKLCAGLVANEKQLLTLVSSAQYNPLEMASGATDLINEAATAKISGEEERYSNTDFPVFQANIDGAMEVVSLLQPYLQHKDPAVLAQISTRHAAITSLLARYKADPGYDGTGYVEYSAVLDSQRRQLSAAVNALAESLSGLSVQVSS